jgi:GNAT superfamily N-acetyltransferase
MEDIRIEWLPLPATLAADGGADYAAAATLEDHALAEVLGHRDFCESAPRRLERAQPSDYGMQLRCVARGDVDGRILGTASVWLPLAENTDMAIVDIAVAPAARRRGIGTRLFREAEAEAARRGREKLNSWVNYPLPPLPGRESGGLPGGGAVLPSKGDGAVPDDLPATRFARALGMDLRQVERVSRLDVVSSARRVDALALEAKRASDGEYDVVGWVGPVPGWAVEGYCRMIEKMDTDTPAGGLEWDQSVWDEARLRVAEERASRRDCFTVHSCAVHRGTGQLVAFTALEVARDTPEAAFQEDTLVLEGHRGHKLGLLVKTANFVRIREAWPTVRRIYTWNAEENAHMLAINVSMGFRGAQSEGAWEKKTRKNPQNVVATGDPCTATLDLSADDSVE